MAKFKIIISDPETGKSQAVELEGSRAVPLIGRKLGETIDGAIVGLSGQKVQITGGCDRDGFPMRFDVHGGVRANIILSEGVGFHPKREGERRRKNVRGSVITEEIAQINMKIAKNPEKEKSEKIEKTEKALPDEKTIEEQPKTEPTQHQQQ
ncbi:MAG: 30S ribosomal protein S6e [Candidatus Bathyarchaeia archaeon]|jgi:small subunit ribosomal protein S6e|nr:30S ribosomal protein S6e [Candidatus Bathyarchaeota archaeon A05DMB-4]MDH7595844.1 30S ribosomal protein S6e [Candidatus Bathyarchaeota archaeon]